MDERSTRIVPDSPNKPYDIRDVVRYVVDDGEFLEVHEHYAQNIVVGLQPPERLRDRRRRQPAEGDGRRAGHRRVAKAARFVRFCDAFNIRC
jgi:propionyl-CoA carboxylase beta chain